jgi:hypothetical protein
VTNEEIRAINRGGLNDEEWGRQNDAIHAEAMREHFAALEILGLLDDDATEGYAFSIHSKILNDREIDRRKRCEDPELPAVVTTSVLEILREMTHQERQTLRDRVTR